MKSINSIYIKTKLVKNKNYIFLFLAGVGLGIVFGIITGILITKYRSFLDIQDRFIYIATAFHIGVGIGIYVYGKLKKINGSFFGALLLNAIIPTTVLSILTILPTVFSVTTYITLAGIFGVVGYKTNEIVKWIIKKLKKK